MKFGFSILTSELSGSLNGIVASSSRGNVGYFRTRVTPSNPRTYLQTVIRAILTGIAGAWRSTLSDGQRAAWGALATGSSSGIDAYTGANTILMQGGTARQDTAPSSLSLSWLAIPTSNQFEVGAGAPGSVTATLTVAGNTLGADGEKISFYVQNIKQPSSRLALIGNTSYAGTFTIAGTVHPTITVSEFTHPLLGTVVADNLVNVEVLKYKSNGQVAQRVANLTAAS